QGRVRGAPGAHLQAVTMTTHGDVAAVGTETVDPVCGMTIAPEDSVSAVEHGGRTYHFCAESCARRFPEDPERFLQPAASAPAPEAPARAAGAAEYTCPMHPEVVRDGPGACPICGMALEPRTASAEESNSELIQMQRRFWISALLTLPLLALMVADMLPERPLHALLGARAGASLQLVLATPVVLWGGWAFFERGARSVVRRHLIMFTLCALGTGVASGFSVLAPIVPGAFPASLGAHGGIAVYFEPAAVIVSLVLMGQVLELRARARTGGAIRALLALVP